MLEAVSTLESGYLVEPNYLESYYFWIPIFLENYLVKITQRTASYEWTRDFLF